jgi:hypothetical protein
VYECMVYECMVYECMVYEYMVYECMVYIVDGAYMVRGVWCISIVQTTTGCIIMYGSTTLLSINSRFLSH